MKHYEAKCLYCGTEMEPRPMFCSKSHATMYRRKELRPAPRAVDYGSSTRRPYAPTFRQMAQDVALDSDKLTEEEKVKLFLLRRKNPYATLPSRETRVDEEISLVSDENDQSR